MNIFGLVFSFLVPGILIGALFTAGLSNNSVKKHETKMNYNTQNVCVNAVGGSRELMPAPSYTLRERTARRNSAAAANQECVTEKTAGNSAG